MGGNGVVPQQRSWTGLNLEGARGYAHNTLGSATRSANELHEAITRDPGLRARLGPLADKLLDAADTARLVEHELAAALADLRRGGA